MTPTIFRIWLRILNSVLFVLAVAAPIGAGEIEVPFEPLEPSSPEVKRLISLAESGALDKAVADAQKLASKQPDNIDAWMFLGLMQAESGEYEKALAAFEKGIRKTDADLPFLLMMARVHEERGRLGPGGARIGGSVRYTKAPDNIDADAFKSEQFRAAAKCFERALGIRPGVKPYQAKQVELLTQATETQAAYDAAKEYVKINPDYAELWLRLARAAQLSARWEEAQEAAMRCLALNDSEAGACEIMAELSDKKGDANSAGMWRQKWRFHSAIPGFFAVPYSGENYAMIKDILEEEYEPEDPKIPGAKTVSKEWIARVKNNIDTLIAQKSGISSQLMGAIALSHQWHGEIENRIYAELEARKDEALLVMLLRKAQSACTIGSCAPALARLKSDAAFPLIVELLPNDRGMFSMRIPEALAIYGRPEAAAMIASALRETMGRLESSGGSPNALMSGFGERIFARRCIWALEDFKTPETQSALAKAAREDGFRSDALAVLFYQTREKTWFTQLIAHLKRNPRGAEEIAEYFRKTGLPNVIEIEKIAQAAKKQDEQAKSNKAKRAKDKK